MARTVTLTQANRYCANVAKAFRAQEGYGPKVIEGWDGSTVVVWEDGAPYGWVYLLDGGIDEEFGFNYPAVKTVAGVFAEPVNNCVVALYRA